MEGEQRICPGELVPDIGGENVKEARGRQDHGRQFLLLFDVVFGEIGITGDAVIDQVGDVAAIKAFIVAETREAGGWINPKSNTDDGNEDEAEKKRSRETSDVSRLQVSRHVVHKQSQYSCTRMAASLFIAGELVL